MHMLDVRPARAGVPTDLGQVFNWNARLTDAIMCIDSLPLEVPDELAGKTIYTHYTEIVNISEIDRIAYYLRNIAKPMSSGLSLLCTGPVFTNNSPLTESTYIKYLKNFLVYLNGVMTNDFGLPIESVRTCGLMGTEKFWAKASVFAKIPCCVTLPGTSVKRVYTIDVNGNEVGFDSVEEYRQYAGI